MTAKAQDDLKPLAGNLTQEQTQSFLAAARQDKWYVAFLIAVETGARPNEYLALRWHDVDFDERSVRICRTLYWPPWGGFEFTKPKTQRSVRTKTISRQAIEALREHRRKQLEQRMQTRDYQDNDLIFATEIGTPLSWRNLGRRHLKPLLAAASIPEDGFSMYSLRHTHASLRIINGDNLRVVAEDMGTSVAMIDITYSHVPRALQTSAAERLAGMLYGT
ncbi:MAG: site-specific integrase [Pyrinomonadaceae bacterium]|nr:site-specific integrase [Pyrinomonadaceae bacterium]